ncbi:hypothetical protein [Cobetia sp. 5-11-6-3]|uniref:hypothetical protein n=1 Tax=Cobetia sp. 5-11-6-3 TaxID=2737458 RepID=UPI001596A6ED|nr:hypothetical protein [Cobetia sp. 5-11-6-3]
MFTVSILVSSVEKESYSLFEKNLPLVLGATFGGVLACTSIIVGMLTSSSMNVKRKAKKSDHFKSFVTYLEKDVKLLLLCLFLAVSLPYFRVYVHTLDVLYFANQYVYLVDKAFSSIQIFVAMLAFLIIYEIVDVVVYILKHIMLLGGANDNAQESNTDDE